MTDAAPSAPTRVLFLDIDGVMIPATMVLVDVMASHERKFPATTIAVLNRLLVCAPDLAIVINSTHADHWDGVPDIIDALAAHGLPRERFHPADPFTEYPARPRGEAVTRWLDRHPEVGTWLAFDDAAFADDDRLIWIDPNAGLHLGHLNQALGMLGCKPTIILM